MKQHVSFTQAFYDLLDLPDEEQARALNSIRQRNPALSAKLHESLGSEQKLDISQIIGFNANNVTNKPELYNLTGQNIGKYRLLKELGRGGMGVVYEAERADKTFEQNLAIKFIQPSINKIISTDFLYLEAQLLARLNHPYIAKVFDGGKHEDLIYIAMEKVEGKSLREIIDERELSGTQALRLFHKIASAIEHAHQNQILHADIKPENIIIDESGSPKVLDFNITQKVKDSRDTGNTALLAYSESFASPEQKSGAYLTNQSDVYSLGKLLDVMLPNARQESDEVAVINKATEAEPFNRYSSVEAMITDIQNILEHQPISLKANHLGYVVRKLVQRKPFYATAILLLVVSTIMFSGILIQKNHQLNTEKVITEEMIFEMTQLLFHSKGDVNREHSVQNMLELTRRRILSNPELPRELKQKMLLAMMTPVPDRSFGSPQNTRQSEEK